jgi:hypothetical protein
MCDCHPTTPSPPGRISRRELIVGAALATPALLAATALVGGRHRTVDALGPAVPAVEVLPGLRIYPREAWGADLPAKAPIQPETPRFLLVHHTASPNNYANPISVIRTTYMWHTSHDPTKGWPDVAYEFFVGRDGDVWEGRTGALAGPVMASATGGSQGFAQLVCMLGDFTSTVPTPAAQASLVKVLAWMADRCGIDTAPGATTSFVSRGSQRWPAGTRVTTRTIAGHREMSYTGCPGDSFFPHIGELPAKVQAQRAAWAGVTKPAVRLGRVTP